MQYFDYTLMLIKKRKHLIWELNGPYLTVKLILLKGFIVLQFSWNWPSVFSKLHTSVFAISFLWLFIDETWIPSTQGCFVLRLVEISPMVLERFLNIVNVFSLFHRHFPLQLCMVLLIAKYIINIAKDTLDSQKTFIFTVPGTYILYST